MSAEFGILTNGIVLQLFYKPLGVRKPYASKVLSVRFDGSDKDGNELGELLDHSTFSEQKLKTFCEEKMNKIKNQTEGVPLSQQFVAEQMSEELDEKIIKMSSLYKEWVATNPKEKDFIRERENAVAWVEENVLNLPKIRKITEDDFKKLMHEIPNHLTNLKFGAVKALYTNLDGKKMFLSGRLSMYAMLCKKKNLQLLKICSKMRTTKLKESPVRFGLKLSDVSSKMCHL